MTVYEHDDQGLRVIGYNHGVYFYDPTRTLQCELYLKPDGTLASNCEIVSTDGGGGGGAGLTAAAANLLYVRLDGNNWASWIPAGGTQSVVGSFNLQGAAYQYKISGRHALSMPGTANLLAGDGAGAALTTGAQNVLMGYQAGAALTNNDENVIVGSGAGVASGYLDDIVLIGFAAMSEADSVGGYNSVVIGNNSGGAAEIMDSVVIGSTALRDATAAAYSSADVIIGGGAVIGGANPYEGDYNVIIGTQAAPNLEDADSNVLAGYGVARAATTASRNVVIGTEAGEDMLDAWVNVILGWRTGYQLTDGDYNTIIGAQAGGALTTGSSNTIVGYQAGNAIATVAGGVYLGNQAGYYETAANKLFIDNATRASEADARVKALIYGVFDAATANQYLTINGHLIVRETATLANTGLHLLDTNASHDLIIAPGSDLTADRTLTITTGDADRTLTLANSGTAVVGTGTATRLAEWSDANTIAASTLIKSGAGVLTLAAAGAYTLTVPATGTALAASAAITAGYIPFGIAGSLLGSDAALFWDNVHKWLGIGGTPTVVLDVIGDANGFTSAQFKIHGLSNANQELWLGYDTTNNLGVVQVILQGSDVKPLCLNPNGGNVLIGTTTNNARLTIDQSYATGTQPVLFLDQGDDDETMMEFAGAIGTGNVIEAVGAKTLTVTHYLKCEITGVGIRYLALGTIA